MARRWIGFGWLGVIALLFSLGCPLEDKDPGSAPDGGVEEDSGVEPPPLEPTPTSSISGELGHAEDPALLTRADGSIWVAFFAEDASGNADLYVRHAPAGTLDWSEPDKLTDHPDDDLYPNLYEDNTGVLHLVWYRQAGSPTFTADVLVRELRSDGWTEEVLLNPEASSDLVPTITGLADGTLLVYFASQHRDHLDFFGIYVQRRDPQTLEWGEPVLLDLLPEIEPGSDHLPYAARTPSGDVVLTWTRYYAPPPAWPWSDNRQDVYLARSSDGVVFQPAIEVAVNEEGVADIFPGLSTDGKDMQVYWLRGQGGQGAILRRSLDDLGGPSSALPRAESIPGTDGYSVRITPTATPGIFMAIWVHAEDGVGDVQYRLFSSSAICTDDNREPFPITDGGYDEDGMFALDSEGTVHFAFISRRSGNIDLRMMESVDGRTWTNDRAVLASPDTDMMNTFFIDEEDTFWLSGRVGSIANGLKVSRSVDGGDSFSEPSVIVDLGITQNYGAMLRKDDDGVLWVVYSLLVGGNRDLYVRHSSDDGLSWSEPARITSDSRHDGYAYFDIDRQSKTLVVGWLRWQDDPEQPVPFLGRYTDIVLATSSDGESWDTIPVTNDPVETPALDTIPGLIEGPAGLYLTFLTTRLDGGQVRSVVVPVTHASDESAWRVRTEAGYSTRSVELPDGRFVIAGVKGDEPDRNYEGQIVCDFLF